VGFLLHHSLPLPSASRITLDMKKAATLHERLFCTPEQKDK
jgi:hypothetical protein